MLTLLVCMILYFFMCRNNTNENQEEIEIDIPFDVAKWKVKKDKDYTYRKLMYKDILYDFDLRKLHKDSLESILGKADREQEGFSYYLIEQNRVLTKTLHTRTLVVKYKADNQVDWIKLHE